MLKASDVMVTQVYSVRETATVREVLELFAQNRISGAPIITANKTVVGYISGGDIMRQLGKHSPTQGYVGWATIGSFYGGLAMLDPEMEPGRGQELDELKSNAEMLFDKKAIDIGSKKVITVNDDTDLVDVAELLAKKNIKKVPVIEGQRVVGVISRGDIVRTVVQRFLNAHS